MITAKLKNGKPIGAYQKGDWSKHPDFNEKNFKVYNSFKEFQEALNNVYVPFSEDEVKSLSSNPNSYCNDDNNWK